MRYFFFFKGYGDHGDHPSSPTRRSPDLTSKPASPASATVGSSRAKAERLAVDTASPRMRPARIWGRPAGPTVNIDRKSTRLNSSHGYMSYTVVYFNKKPKSVELRECRVA